jgi:hypothetical protein
LIGLAGFLVNWRQIRAERADRKEQSEAEWAREWAAQRPLVYPLPLREWVMATDGPPYFGSNAMSIPLKNGGRGPALDVHVAVEARSQPDGAWYQRETLRATIAAGDLFNARISPNPGIQHWIGSKGVVRYRDLAGGWYETPFEGVPGPGGEIDLRVGEAQQLETGVERVRGERTPSSPLFQAAPQAVDAELATRGE